MSRTRPQFLCGVVEGFYGRPWTLEQRIDLFSHMSSWGMNTYLYAPKDDDKHRAYWRELYSLEEADQLSQLIKEADNKGILFIYAIAPGLDVTFSSSEEVTLLKRKLKQVSALGCKSFAILFDDIDCDMCAADAKEFPSFAHAQVTVTNDLYTYLEHPDVFLFCPTEYCGSRATPTVTESQYLKHIGSDLHPNIDIMWTGPKVISKTIPLSSIENLTKVLGRAPVIWDNLHANDYDQRRLFLGPYSGRSTALIPKLNGVLTNPNCEYGANYIPIHTLAQWAKCGVALAKRPSPTKQAMMLEIEGSNNGTASTGEENTAPSDSSKMADIQQKSDVSLYDPKVALEISIRQWCHEFSIPRRKPEHYKPVKNASSVAMAFDAGDHDDVSEQAGEGALLSPKIKDIDSIKDTSPCVTSDPFTLDDLRYLIDYFYLPHLHGERAINLLEEFCWLKENAPGYELLQINDKLKNSCLSDEEEKDVPMATARERVVASDGMRSDGEASESIPGEEMSKKEVSAWCERAAKFHDVCTCVSEMFCRLTAIPNRALLYDVYQYTWDAKEATMLLDSYIAWLEAGGSEVNPDHEPFVPRGGFVAEMQQLLPQVKGSKKLFSRSGQAPKEPLPVIFTIRPYREEDREMVYQTCLETGSSGQDATQLFTNYPNLLGDRFVGPYTTLSPELSFVVEDSEGVCGYVLAVLDLQAFYQQFKKEWLPTVIGNYPAPLPKPKGEKLSPEEELIQDLHDIRFFLPAKLQRDYPSHLHIDLMKRCQGKGIGTRMIKTILATLKAKGSHGVHLEMAADNLRALKFYHKLGFKVLDFEIDTATGEGLPPDEVLILGRQL